MKTIQKEITIKSSVWFIIMLISNIGCIYGLISEYKEEKLLINIISLIAVFISGYFSYKFSFIYTFKIEEIIVKPIFGLIGERKFRWKSLDKIEFCINKRGTVDKINLYFNKKISISLEHDLGEVKLFLSSNIENFKELEDEYFRN